MLNRFLSFKKTVCLCHRFEVREQRDFVPLIQEMLFCPSAFNSQSHYFVSDNVPMKSAPRLIHVHCWILWYPVALLLHKRFISRRSNELYWWMQQDLLPCIWCKENQSMEDFFFKKRSFCLFNYQHSFYLFLKTNLTV